MISSVKLIAAAALVLAAGQAMAVDDNVDVKVTGQIVPPACVPAISGGAVFDYGGIKAAALAQDDFTILRQKTLTFNLTCNSPMKVAFKTTDGRKGSSVIPVGKTLQSKTVAADAILFGLGAANGKNIGGYQLNIAGSTVKVDGVSTSVDIIRSDDAGASWSISTPAEYFFFRDDGYYYSIASKKAGDNLPITLTTLSGLLNMQAALNKASELDLTQINNLDGFASIQVVYL